MLPPEIVVQILEGLRESESPKRALQNCCLVNSVWINLAQPLLFRDLSIEHVLCSPNAWSKPRSLSTLATLLEAIVNRPDLATFIHTLTLRRMKKWNAVDSTSALACEQNQHIVSLLPRLTHIRSIVWVDSVFHWLTPEVQKAIFNLFHLPSLVSLNFIGLECRTPYDLFTNIIAGKNLRTLHLSEINFESPSRMIPSHSSTAPRSVPLTALHLKQIDIIVVTNFLSDPNCPFSFASLSSLHLITLLHDRRSASGRTYLTNLFELLGGSVKHLVMTCSQDHSTPLLEFTPFLKTLLLLNLTQNRTSNAVERVQSLFPPSPSTIESITLAIYVDKWLPWRSLDEFFANTIRFPSLRRVELWPVSTTVPSDGWIEDTKIAVELWFPVLLRSNKLRVNPMTWNAYQRVSPNPI
ncbi:hypothetical protein V5O48_005357 [Marasmius crinis-equi]|uniref:F-box domain-containing protein n=1 Tax=Marasmius crinis-equi TaxID=585013 RepID=A0ABR3FMI1_9AGAR